MVVGYQAILWTFTFNFAGRLDGCRVRTIQTDVIRDSLCDMMDSGEKTKMVAGPQTRVVVDATDEDEDEEGWDALFLDEDDDDLASDIDMDGVQVILCSSTGLYVYMERSSKYTLKSRGPAQAEPRPSPP
jgi:hypothetical protein